MTHYSQSGVSSLFQETMETEKILVNYKVAENGCWEWLGVLERGYGRFYANGKTIQAHRHFYEHFKGKIPTGLAIDHLCYNRKCVNPEHLEAVTNSENTRRMNEHMNRTHCPHGHPYSGSNMYKYFDQKNNTKFRICKICRKNAMRRLRAKKKWVVSQLKRGDMVKIVRKPRPQSRYGWCCGYEENIGKTGIVESADGMHIFVAKLGGCFQPEQLIKITPRGK